MRESSYCYDPERVWILAFAGMTTRRFIQLMPASE